MISSIILCLCGLEFAWRITIFYWQLQDALRQNSYGPVAAAGYINVHLIFHCVLRILNGSHSDDGTACIGLPFFHVANLLGSIVGVYTRQPTGFCTEHCHMVVYSKCILYIVILSGTLNVFFTLSYGRVLYVYSLHCHMVRYFKCIFYIVI